MKKYYKNNKQSGFGLIEVLVSLAILTIVVLGFNHLSNIAFISWENAKNKAIAYNIIQDTFEDIRNIRDANVNTSGVDWFDTLDALDGLEETVEGFPSFTKKITIETLPVTLNGLLLSNSKKKITIEVSWSERRGERSLKSITYLTNWRGRY